MIAWLPRLWALWVGCAGPAPMEPLPEPVEWVGLYGIAREIAADRACLRGDAEACWWVGLRRRWSHDDPEGAWAAWSHGCDLDEAKSCEAVGLLHWRGVGTKADVVVAEVRLDKACRLGAASACHARDSVVRVNLDMQMCFGPSTRTAATCGRACLGGAVFCDEAIELLAPSCDGGEAVSCTMLGRIVGEGAEGSAWLWKGCDLDDPWACLALADRVARGGENPSPKSLEWLFTQVCDIQLDYGCAVHRVPWPVEERLTP